MKEGKGLMREITKGKGREERQGEMEKRGEGIESIREGREEVAGRKER